ncbi:MAG: Gfo/Idh/MocA family oxidoreductase [Bryobacteraceae bacterium]
MHRRQFLASASLALSAQGAPRRIRTGILGIQHSHLAGKLQVMYDNPAYEVVSICEPNEDIRRDAAGDKRFARLQWVTMEQLLGDRSLDLIVFEGEVKDAVPFGKKVLEAGKHLHLEKPPTSRLEPFRELVELARRRDRKLQLGYLYRFHPGVDAALEAARNGWLGGVFMIRATMNSDRDAKQRGVEARYPGGSMFELGGHQIDRVIAFLGKPTHVRTWLRHDTTIKDTLKDNTLAVFEYPTALATVVSSARDAASHRSLEVIGSDGSMTIDPMEPAPVLRVQMREGRGPYQKGMTERRFPAQPRFHLDFADLARAIQSETPLRYSYDHELLLHETLLRASGEIV